MDFLKIENLEITFFNGLRSQKLVKDLDLQIEENEIFGLVGESGSGKTMTALAILGLLPSGCKITSGKIFWQGKNLIGISPKDYQAIRGGEISLIFQDPFNAFNPVISLGVQLAEVLEIHFKMSRREALENVKKLLLEVNLPVLMDEIVRRYPHELSGGQLQRVALALALGSRPKLLIADEPTTALDVLTQFQILNLLKNIQKKYQMSILFISHDLSLIKYLSGRVAVIKNGQIIESGPTEKIFQRPEHLYTKQLIDSIPVLKGR